MREKKGVLLTLMISALSLGACGNQDSVAASVAGLEVVPIRQEDGNAGEGGNAGTTPGGAGGSGGEGMLSGSAGGNGGGGTEPGSAAGSGEGGLTPGSAAGRGEGGLTPGGAGGSGGEGMAPDSAGGNGGGGTEPGSAAGSGEGGLTPGAEFQPGEARITISVAGDVAMGNYIGQGYEISFRQTYDQGAGDSYFFENVADIFSADDMTLVNLEGPLTRSGDFREGQTYCISGEPEYVNILTAGSVEAVSMGNNHRLDYKEQGTSDTVEALEGAGILYAYDNNYCMYETNGIQIGIVSVNEVGQGAGVEKYLQEGIAQLRQEGADLVFACCHWGIEREYYPEDYQKSLGKKCIDWGYDLVIGHHPHVLQGIEEYQGKFIIYSLGNFCFGANRNPPDKDSMIFQQTFTFVDGEKRKDKEIRVIPCSVSSVASRNDYKPTPAEGEEAQRILDKINEFSRDFGVEFGSDGYLLTGLQ